MDIEFNGARKYRGTTSLIKNLALESQGDEDEGENNIWWDRISKQIIIKFIHDPHKDGRTYHNYRIKLTLEDLASLITLVADEYSANDAAVLKKAFGKKITAMIKLLACAAGFILSPMSDNKSASSSTQI